MATSANFVQLHNHTHYSLFDGASKIPDLVKRAKELGMSMYDVVTLASVIEKEARVSDDFYRVSAVFSNRMKANMNLDSDATLEYVLKTGSLHLTEEQLATPSGYNTHTNSGLPLGPVSNPGDTAIKAALYPNSEYIADNYLYFCLMDPDSGAGPSGQSF